MIDTKRARYGTKKTDPRSETPENATGLLPSISLDIKKEK